MHPVPLGESGGSKGQGQGGRRGITRPARSEAEEGWGDRPNWRRRREPLPGARGDPLGLFRVLTHGLTTAQRPPQAGP